MSRHVEIIQFHPKHLEVAMVRDLEQQTVMRIGDAYARFEALAERSKQAVTVMHDGRILACCGFFEAWKGVCEVWLVPTIYVPKYPILFARTMKGYVESIAKTFDYHRVQTIAAADELHDRWMGWLGFECEGVLRQYTEQKQDYKLHARLFQWA